MRFASGPRGALSLLFVIAQASISAVAEPATPRRAHATAAVSHRRLRELHPQPVPVGTLKSLPKLPSAKHGTGAVVPPIVITEGAAFPTAGRRAAGGGPLLVYSNTQNLAGLPAGAGVLVADDLTTTCPAGGELITLEFAVGGGGEGGGPGFGASFELYDGCPAQGGQPISGTSGSVDFDDDDVYVVSIDYAGLSVEVPAALWLAVQVSNDNAFVVAAGPPELGFSEDLIHLENPAHPELACNAWFGGYPNGPYASLYAIVEIADCSSEPQFLGFASDAYSGLFYGAQSGSWLADDIILGVQECHMGRLEVQYAGITGPFSGGIELRRDASGLPGDVITGTPVSFDGSGSGLLERFSFTFDPPIPLPSAFWVLHRDTSDSAGVVVAGASALMGFSQDSFLSSDDNGASWQRLFFGGCSSIPHNGCGIFNATVWCTGAPPDPIAACCLGGGACQQLTASTCAGQGGQWWSGLTCASSAVCHFEVCGDATGDCFTSSSTPGCSDPACCAAVCSNDDFCCTVTWDTNCAFLASEICADLPNDACADAQLVAAGSYPLNTLAATTDGPTLPPECDEGYGADLGADVWFEWQSNDCGRVTISTCNNATFDTRLAVYEGCDCPVDNARLLGCNDDGDQCVGFTSRLSFDVQDGLCYKIRLGGFAGAAGSGTLSVVHEPDPCMDACPTGQVLYLSPPDGVVDARLPHRPDEPQNLLGIVTLHVQAPSGADDPSCWSVCEGGSPSSNRVTAVEPGPNATFVLHLQHPLAPGTMTSVSYAGDDSVGHFTFHPGNVNGDAAANSLDVLALIDYLNGVQEQPWDLFSTDIDHSGVLAPADIIVLADLLNGAGALQSWNQTARPPALQCP